MGRSSSCRKRLAPICPAKQLDHGLIEVGDEGGDPGGGGAKPFLLHPLRCCSVRGKLRIGGILQASSAIAIFRSVRVLADCRAPAD